MGVGNAGKLRLFTKKYTYCQECSNSVFYFINPFRIFKGDSKTIRAFFLTLLIIAFFCLKTIVKYLFLIHDITKTKVHFFATECITY